MAISDTGITRAEELTDAAIAALKSKNALMRELAGTTPDSAFGKPNKTVKRKLAVKIGKKKPYLVYHERDLLASYATLEGFQTYFPKRAKRALQGRTGTVRVIRKGDGVVKRFDALRFLQLANMR
jgi:hypothetical protein